MLAVAMAGTTRVAGAQAQGAPTDNCDPTVHAWTASCATREHLSVQPLRCVEQRLMAAVRVEGAPEGRTLEMEIRGDDGRGFRRAGGLSLSPVGDHGDWSQEAPEIRAALDRMVHCAETSGATNADLIPALSHATGRFGGRDAHRASPSPGTTAMQENPTPSPDVPSDGHPPVPLRFPWRWAAGWALCLAACVRALRGFSPRGRLSLTGILLGLTLATFVFQRALVPASFFHQNGHGAMWVRFALAGGSPYGPGAQTLFGWAAARAGLAAEQGVFLQQSLVLAMLPAWAWLALRVSGAGTWPSMLGALFVLVHPVLARIARSEAYAGPVIAEMTAGAAVLALGRVSRWRDGGTFALGALGSALLIAEAATLHPMAWMGSAVLPVVPWLQGPGALRRRAAWSVGFAAVCAAGTALIAGPTLRWMLSRSLGGQFAPLFLSQRAWAFAGLSVVALAVMAGGTRASRSRWVRAACAAAASVGVLLLARFHDPHAMEAPGFYWVQGEAWRLPFAGLFCVAVAPVLAALPQRGAAKWGTVAGLVLVIAGLHARSWSERLQMPTDRMESTFAFAWRAQVPETARVYALTRVGPSIFELPLYGDAGRGSQFVLELPADGRVPASPVPVFYYRSSLCSTAQGRPLCDAFEQRNPMVRVAKAAFPARTSMRQWTYDEATVRVGLYRVQ